MQIQFWVTLIRVCTVVVNAIVAIVIVVVSVADGRDVLFLFIFVSGFEC